MFKLGLRMRKKNDLSNFEHVIVLGVRRAGLSISETADLLKILTTTISLVHPVSDRCVDENSLLTEG